MYTLKILIDVKPTLRKKLALYLSWAVVAIPALWGVWQTLLQALQLFR